MSPKKQELLKKMSDKNGVISALAIDQRGSLKRMLAAASGKPANEEDIVDFKKVVSSELTKYASAILLDPQYGLPAAKVRDASCGLLTSYENTGFIDPGHMPSLLPDWSVRRLIAAGADSIKVLLYYNPDEDKSINEKKHAFIERIGDECDAENIPLFVEFVTYDNNVTDSLSPEYAKLKPSKVIRTVKEFSKPQYKIDVLKLEVPVNMDYVESYNGDNPVVYTRDEAKKFFKAESDATNLPYIFLSAGVTTEMFQDELKLAHEAGAKFNGVLCGRATWRHAVDAYGENGEQSCRK